MTTVSGTLACLLFIVKKCYPLLLCLPLAIFIIPEYYYFIKLGFRLFRNKKNPNYSILNIANINYTPNFYEEGNSGVVGKKTSEIHGFLTLYTLLQSKKFNIKIFLSFLLILVLGFPLKLGRRLKSLYDFRESTFKETLQANYYAHGRLVTDKKIETINHEILLNGFTIDVLIKCIQTSNRKMAPEKCYKLLQEMQNMSRYYQKWETEQATMTLGRLVKDGKLLTPVPHYTVLENENSLHVTSNTNIVKFHACQEVGNYVITSAIKKGSKYPGTIYSKNVEFQSFQKIIRVNKMELNAAKLQGPESFNLEAHCIAYLHAKTESCKELLLVYECETNDLIQTNQPSLLKSLIANNYAPVLLTLTDFQLEEAVKAHWDHDY